MRFFFLRVKDPRVEESVAQLAFWPVATLGGALLLYCGQGYRLALS